MNGLKLSFEVENVFLLHLNYLTWAALGDSG